MRIARYDTETCLCEGTALLHRHKASKANAE